MGRIESLEEGVAPQDVTPSQGEKSENEGDASVFIKKKKKLSNLLVASRKEYVIPVL